MTDLDRDDPTFLADLRASQDVVVFVQRWLSRRHGLPVILYPTFERPDPSQIDEYSDNGDLGVVYRLEVKGKRFAFTGIDDFPYRDVFVDSCRAFDRARPKPYAYVIVSCDLAVGLWIDVPATRARWRRIEYWQGGRTRYGYLCPRDLARVVRFADAPPPEIVDEVDLTGDD